MTTQYDYYITPQEYEIAAQNGISKEALDQRIRALAWPKERALTQPPEKKRKLPKEWLKIAEQNGICYSTFRHRVNQDGWDPERAATEPVCSKEQKQEYARAATDASRKYPAEIIDLARKNGISYNTFRTRIGKLGWNPLYAATRPIMTRREIGLMVKSQGERSFLPGKRYEKAGVQ